MAFSDEIVRTLELPGAPNDVWSRAFGSADALSAWFPERVEGDFGPGSTFWLIWGEHRCECRMVAFEPDVSLAFQWHPGEALSLVDRPESELTTVSFAPSPHGAGTEVTMREHGFASIAADRRQWAYDQNNEGWDDELPKLNRLFIPDN